MEHVPPRCLFPERRDIAGEDHRMNLITVPSCEIHNTAKSRDDEFLMVSLAGVIGNNSIGYRHKLGKVDRAIRRSADRLLEKVFLKKTRPFAFEFAPNKFIDVIWGTPDAARLQRCFDHIARGLHMHHFGIRFSGSVRFHLGYLWAEDKNARTLSKFLEERAAIDLEGKERYGANPQVFFYQVTDRDQFGLYLFRLCFYGGLNVYAAFVPQGTQPPANWVKEFIDAGVKTVVTLRDERYEFN